VNEGVQSSESADQIRMTTEPTSAGVRYPANGRGVRRRQPTAATPAQPATVKFVREGTARKIPPLDCSSCSNAYIVMMSAKAHAGLARARQAAIPKML
jgi:hypothetical protein